jgi:hypothetical protein
MENTTMIIMSMENMEGIMIATENIMKCIIMNIPKTCVRVIVLNRIKRIN